MNRLARIAEKYPEVVNLFIARHHSRRNRRRQWGLRCGCWVLAWLVAAGTGATAVEEAGDNADPAAAESDQAVVEKQTKPPLEIGPLAPRLGQEVGELAAEGPVLVVKPGHWGSTAQSMKANYRDFVGRLTLEVVEGSDRPVPLQHTYFGLQTRRSIALAKGRTKQVEADLFVPNQTAGTTLSAKLLEGDSGEVVYDAQLKLVRQPAYQYTIVVLAKEVERYGFLKVTNAVRAPWEEEFDESSAPHYQVALVKATQEIPLSENPLTWTNIAYVVWDEVDPQRLSQQQQQALVDWLHWGGRLIINGPDSLTTLRGSFLDPWLPADDGGTRELSAADLADWSSYWSQRAQGEPLPGLTPIKPLPGIQLLPREQAVPLVGGALFFERFVGSGSIVVSAGQLADRELLNWPGFDGFLNGGLLRRPQRMFSEGPYGGTAVNWLDHPTRRLDAHLVTPRRLFARDALVGANTTPRTTPGTINLAKCSKIPK